MDEFKRLIDEFTRDIARIVPYCRGVYPNFDTDNPTSRYQERLSFTAAVGELRIPAQDNTLWADDVTPEIVPMHVTVYEECNVVFEVAPLLIGANNMDIAIGKTVYDLYLNQCKIVSA